MMEVFKLTFLLTSLLIFYFVLAEDYMVGEIDTEEIFRKYHPETKNITWDDIETLTPAKLQRICDQVLSQLRKNELSGFIKDYHYAPVNASDLLTLRVLRNAPFFSFLKGEQEELTVIMCAYDIISFYLTRADDNNVFRLVQDSTGVLNLKSGPHPVKLKD